MKAARFYLQGGMGGDLGCSLAMAGSADEFLPKRLQPASVATYQMQEVWMAAPARVREVDDLSMSQGH